jgi:hypothetical protein
MFSANAYAASDGLMLRGKPVTPIVPRAAMQVLFIVAIAAAGFARVS